MLSYTSCPSLQPFVYETFGDRLRRFAEQKPNKTAIIYYDLDLQRNSITRKELLNKSLIMASQLVAMGIHKGDVLGFCMDNSIDMAIAIVAVLFAGGVPFYMSTQLKDGQDIAETIQLMELNFLFIDANEGGKNWNIVENLLTKFVDKADCSSLGFRVICNGELKTSSFNPAVIQLRDLLVKGMCSVELPNIYPEDLCLYFASSGSTGTPKFIGHTHYSLMNYRTFENRDTGFTEDSIYFNDKPFGWSGGYISKMLTTGLTRVAVHPRLSESELYVKQLSRIIQREHCSHVYVPGYIVQDLISSPDLEKDFISVDTMFCGGERIPKMFTALIGPFCKSFCVWYGSTEMGTCLYHMCTHPDNFEDGIAGIPHEGMEVKIIGEDSDILPITNTGELCSRSVWRFSDYKNMPELFHETVDSLGWVHSGDMAHMREDGKVVIDGREKETISIDTLQLFPWDVEKVLLRCPGVSAAFAVGVPDARLHEVICACIVPKEESCLTVENVKEFCADQFVEESTAMTITLKPKHYLLYDRVPVTATGKISRRQLTEESRRRLGL